MLGGQAGYEMVGGSSKAESMYPYGSAKNAAADSARNGVLPDGGKGYGGSWRGGGGGGGAGGVSPALDEATKVEAMKEDAPRAMWAAAPRRRTGQCFLLAEGLIISYIYLVYTAAVLLPYTFHQARIEFFHDSSIFNTDDNIHTFRDRGGHGDGPFSPLSAFSVSRYILSFRPSFAFMLFACFNGCFMLLVMSIVNAIRTDPGAVPSHWGFFVGDQARRKRYCRICNVWKPDRTHHCSVCHRCVLNMDHHCPWLDNCVGFFNRKFFLLAIVYANVCLSIVFAHTLYFLGTNARTVWPSEFDLQDTSNLHGIDFTHWTLTITMLLLTSLLLAAMIPFLRFHWQLLSTNSTTIESMDPSSRDQGRFDLGTRRNIEQVFGPLPLLWFLPWHTKASMPVGDGVRWRRHYLNDHVDV